MSLYQEKLCYNILKEYFGNIVAEVGRVLMKKGCNTFKYLVTNSKLPVKKVQESVCVLIKHNLVTWDESILVNSVYTLLLDRVILLLRFPRYVFLIREKFGEEAEIVVDVLLKEGQATASQIIIYSALKLLDAAEDGIPAKSEASEKHIKVRNALEKVIKNHYIQRCPSPESADQNIPVLKIKEDDLYRFDTNTLDLKLLQNEIKERRLNPDQNLGLQPSKTALNHPDKEIFWRLNYDRFHLELRDDEMMKSISRRVDTVAGKVFASILKAAYRTSDPWNPEFNTVLASEIRDQEPDILHLDQYLKVIEDSGGKFLRKVGDAGGGEYVLNVATLIRTLTISQMDDVVRERFGSKAARIFRLVRETGMMEQDQIAEQSMISKKEANVLTHRLLNDSFLRLYEVRKGITPTPASKSSYLFYVDVSMLVRMLLEWAYKALYNLMEQRGMKHDLNKRLLERKARVEMIVENLRQSGGTEEQIQEVEEIFSPSERETVKNVIETQDKLLDFETGLDELVFLLQMYLYYEVHK